MSKPQRLLYLMTGMALGCVLTGIAPRIAQAIRSASRNPDAGALVATLGPIRLTEGRLSGAATYAPYPTRPSTRLFAKAVRLGRVEASSPSPLSLRDHALWAATAKEFDSAITSLLAAVQIEPGDAALLASLSALYGERAKAGNHPTSLLVPGESRDRPEDLITSLDFAESAFSLGPAGEEPAFNRALALEHLFLYEEARVAWQRYLDIDSRSPWAAEAQDHIQQISAALALDEKARLVLSEARELEGLVRSAATVAETLEKRGEPGEGWRYRYRALASAGASPEARYYAFDGAVLAALAQGHPRAALALQSHLLLLAETSGGAGRVATALLRRARILASQGRLEKAEEDLDHALRTLETIPDVRVRLAADIEIARSEINASKDRATSIAQDYRPTWPGAESWSLLNARADLEFRRGGTIAGEETLDRALAEMERQRALIPRAFRAPFFDQAQPLFERMVALQLRLDRPGKALEALERFHARALFDQLQQARRSYGAVAPAVPQTAMELSRRLPAKTLVVVYTVVDGRLVTLLIRPYGIDLVREQPAWKEVSSLVDRLRRDGGQGDSALPLVADIGRTLISPWRARLEKKDRIVFVPTRSLFEVPFAALPGPQGRFLIEDHAIAVAPSASAFIASLEKDRQLSSRPLGRVLLAGNPRRDPSSKPGEALPPFLPGAQRELREIQAIYRETPVDVLTQGKATIPAALSALSTASLVHFSLHGLSDPEDSARSYLVLTPALGDSGLLSAQSILGQSLPSTRLAILAACGTQAGRVSPSGGSLSLSAAFLATGVPAVIGTLRPVDDQSASRVSIRFHQEFHRGVDAMEALRIAQVAEITAQQGRFDWTWASFQVLGGVVERLPLRP